jgi:hypothetical protein
MRRRFSARWLPLLAAVFAGLLSACPGSGTNQSAYQAYHPKPLPDYSPYQGRDEPAIKATGQASRVPGSIGRPLGSYPIPKLFAPPPSSGKPPRYSSFIAGSARHFSLFPTGPPRHH